MNFANRLPILSAANSTNSARLDRFPVLKNSNRSRSAGMYVYRIHFIQTLAELICCMSGCKTWDKIYWYFSLLCCWIHKYLQVNQATPAATINSFCLNHSDLESSKPFTSFQSGIHGWSTSLLPNSPLTFKQYPVQYQMPSSHPYWHAHLRLLLTLSNGQIIHLKCWATCE